MSQANILLYWLLQTYYKHLFALIAAIISHTHIIHGHNKSATTQNVSLRFLHDVAINVSVYSQV